MSEHSDAAKAAYPDPRWLGENFQELVDTARTAFDRGVHDPTPHRKMIVEGQIEVCDRCLNANGNPIGWSQTWHEDNKQATTYAVAREALATKLNGRIGNVRVHHDTPEAVASERNYWLEVADAILAIGALVDVNEVKAQALREFADRGNDYGFSDAEGMGWLRVQADLIEGTS